MGAVTVWQLISPLNLTLLWRSSILRAAFLRYSMIFHLLQGRCRLSFSIAKQLRLQTAQLILSGKAAVLPGPDRHHRLDLRAGILCQLRALPDHLPAHIEEILHAAPAKGGLGRVECNDHRDPVRQDQELPHDLVLHRCEAGKAIEDDDAVFYQL